MKINNNINIFLGDSLKELKKLPSNSIDLVLCDLPFGTTQNSWDSVLPLSELFIEYKRICKDNSPIVLFGAMPFSAELVVAGKEIFKYSLVWRKNKSSGHLNAKKRPMRQHEDILVFCKKTPTYYPQKSSGHKPMNAATNEKYSNESKYSPNYGKVKPTKNNAGSTERYPSSVLDFNVVNNDNPIKIHPTQKPVELLEWLIRTYSSENELVLDNTMGSGSTGIACAISNRRFIGIESNLQYFNHAKKWIQSIK